ncbi:helix-turn-helix domain-containing protein [Chromobacterium phragmitis]|uniref:helix-turn-helix domain-containing protein n=1 Tax=Chromobacterium phragmitis TaxID=2202141 RepID=UPI003877DCC4
MGTTLGQRVGANIKAARENLNLPQRVVAERLGIETESLSRIERGAALPSLVTLDRLAGILEVSLVQLLSGISSESASLVASVQADIEPLDEADRLFVLDQVKVLSRKLVEKSKST